MILELRDKLEGLAIGAVAAAAGEKPTALSQVEQDVISALMNLGCNRPAAETAIRKAKAGGVESEFEPLFRRSLELVR
jgi:Holliday junction DNA helicase RuvA